jgi:DNA-binding NtrC family response regulator
MARTSRFILIVDDDTQILKSFKTILESEGFSVDTAESGEEAVKKVKEGAFDAVLLDIKLPGIEGTDVLAILHEISPNIIKIMMTGFPSLDNAIASLKRGADAYIMKPVDPQNLLVVVKKKLEERDAREKDSR